MALGCPVITSRIAGVPELVVEGENGLLFTPAKWDEMADCMGRLLSNPEQRMRLASAAKEKIEAEFNVEKSANQLKAHFEELAGARTDAREGRIMS